MKIGIAGGSCSGKSTLSRSLANETNIRHISLDDYFLNPEGFPIVYGRPDYDRFEAVDWDKAYEDIRSANEPLIVEGFLLLAHRGVRNLFDTTLFIDTPEDIRLGRRLLRDNKNTNDMSYITHHIMSRHDELVEPTKVYADVVLDGTVNIDVLQSRVLGLLALNPYRTQLSAQTSMVAEAV